MHSFLVSLRSEFYKSRKTLAFWGAILLPVAIISLITFGFYAKSGKFTQSEGIVIWGQYVDGVLGVMGVLLMPMFVIFVAYSVNNIEHRADMWKSIFSLPLNRWGIYAGKFGFAVLLIALCLFLFAALLLAGGNILGVMKPDELKFHQYNFAAEAFLLHTKLFLSGMGILAIQFLLSLIWTDFIKPMGIGFLSTVAGIIAANVNWEYDYLIPYAHPLLALQSMKPSESGTVDVNVFSQEVVVGLIVAAVAFVLGYIIVARRSVK
ncbi:ABC transporter permease [Parapedobacter tibetensis]|uniref:ABC transporter permease n=1 Tax=Parapedobacter tibetensis TaxID=2972951 RepID=UPI00214D8136|nr:ABC transporter permease [Parapedobacter tibetensis]